MYIKYLYVGKIKDLQKYINEELQKEIEELKNINEEHRKINEELREECDELQEDVDYYRKRICELAEDEIERRFMED